MCGTSKLEQKGCQRSEQKSEHTYSSSAALILPLHYRFPVRFLILPYDWKPKDYPVLYSAITDGVDIFVTGDSDFAGIDLEHPEIITPAGFLEKYVL